MRNIFIKITLVNKKTFLSDFIPVEFMKHNFTVTSKLMPLIVYQIKILLSFK